MKFIEFEFNDGEKELCISVPMYVVEYLRSDNSKMWSYGIKKFTSDVEFRYDPSKHKLKSYLNSGKGTQAERLEKVRNLILEEVDGTWMYQ